jgi:hypothetical protein
MRLLIIIIALMIALPAHAINAGCMTGPYTGCRTCWKGNITTKVCPNGDWERRDWSSWNVHRRGWYGPHRRARHHHSPHPRERVIECETLRYEHVIKKEVR